jgi:hypothetical protein
MRAAKVIEEIKQLPPKEQAEVIQYAVALARNRQLTPQELGELADRLAQSNDPAEIIRLKSAMTIGFYGASDPPNARIEKHHGFSVDVLDQPINEQALKQALTEFP